jgi:hypothetical protein
MAASAHELMPGKTESTNWIAFDQATTSGAANRIAVLLYPFKDAPASAALSTISDCHYRVTRSGSTDDLYYLNGPFEDSDVATDASFLILRRGQGQNDRFSLVDGTYLRVHGKNVWTSSVRTSAERTLPE